MIDHKNITKDLLLKILVYDFSYNMYPYNLLQY